MTLAIIGIAFLVVGGIRTRDAMSIRLNSWQPATEVTAIDDIVPPDATLGFRFVLAADKPGVTWDDQRRRAQLYQFALPHHPFERDRGIDDDVGPYVFAPTNDKILKAAGGEILWVLMLSHQNSIASRAHLSPSMLFQSCLARTSLSRSL